MRPSEDDGVYGAFHPTGDVTVPGGFDAVFEAPGLALLERPGCIGGTLSRCGDSVIHLFGEIYNVQDVWPASDGSGDDLRSLHELLAAPDWLERLPRLNGSFHITAYDGQARRLRLIADRYGTEVCFYGVRDGGLFFFPHLHHFLGVGFRGQMAPDLLAGMIGFRWLFDKRTFLGGVRVLPHGSVLEMDADGLTLRRYWAYRYDESRDDLDAPRAAVQALGDLLVAAVERRLRGTGKVILSLSGGLDSRAVLGAALECVPASKLLAITYGTPGDLDFELGPKVAGAAGVAHRAFDCSRPTDYEAEFRRKALDADGLTTVLWGSIGDMDTLAEFSTDVMTGLLGDVITGDHLPPAPFAERPADEAEALRGVLRTHQCTRSAVAARLCGMQTEAWERLVIELMASINEGNDHRLVGNYDHAWVAGARFQTYTTVLVHKQRERFRYLAPFADNNLVDFLFALPLRWRIGQRLYRRMLTARFPRLFAVGTRNTDGLPLGRAHATRLARRLARWARKGVERWSGGRWPAHSAWKDRRRRRLALALDLEALFREEGPFRRLCEARLEQVADLGLFDGDAIRAVWDEHAAREADHRRTLATLISTGCIHDVFCEPDEGGA